MINAYYWLQNKFELEFLRQEFRISNCRGFYVPYQFFNNKKTKDAIRESFLLLGKDVLFYYNFNNELRPEVTPDIVINRYISRSKDKKSWKNRKKRKTEATKKLRELCENSKNIKDYIDEKYSSYLEIKGFFEDNFRANDVNTFFSEFYDQDIKICEFEFPFVTLPAGEEVFKYKDLKEIYDLCSNLNEKFFIFQKDTKDYRNSIFNVSLSITDIEMKTPLFEIFLKRSKIFPNIALWITNFNELYVTRKQIQNLKSFIKTFAKFKRFFLFKFVGIYSNRMLREFNNDCCTISRLNGYPGQNINLSAFVKRTRRLADPSDDNYLSLTNVGDKFKDEYSCGCNVCVDNEISDYPTAKEFYLRSDPENSLFYSHLVGRAVKTKHQKIRKIQNRNILKHCFHNLETNLNLSSQEFALKFNRSNEYEFNNRK